MKDFMTWSLNENNQIDIHISGQKFIEQQPVQFEDIVSVVDECRSKKVDMYATVDLKGANLLVLDVMSVVKLICILEEYTRNETKLMNIHFKNGGFVFRWIYRAASLAIPKCIRELVTVS
jgi:hypothetical protein